MTDQHPEGLSACPFCGRTQTITGYGSARVKLMCTGCEATSPPARNEAEAIAAWNRRAAARKEGAARAGMDREAVARIIAEAYPDNEPCNAYAPADAILALGAPTPPVGTVETGEVERQRARSIKVHGLRLTRALARYGFPVSEAASAANMSVEARDLHNAARGFQCALNSTGIPADEPAVTNGQ